MIHAYSKLYINSVMRNIAALFDIAINAEGILPNKFADQFAQSSIAKGIEGAVPDILAGKSATELLTMILNREVRYTVVPTNRTPEYWAGWVLAYTQWKLNKTFKDILSVISFEEIISMYYPYHEASEEKFVEKIKERFPVVSSLKKIRQQRKLTQSQLAEISGVNIRSIRSYEQGDNDILKAQGDTLYMLARALDCSIEELIS